MAGIITGNVHDALWLIIVESFPANLPWWRRLAALFPGCFWSSGEFLSLSFQKPTLQKTSFQQFKIRMIKSMTQNAITYSELLSCCYVLFFFFFFWERTWILPTHPSGSVTDKHRRSGLDVSGDLMHIAAAFLCLLLKTSLQIWLSVYLLLLFFP